MNGIASLKSVEDDLLFLLYRPTDGMAYTGSFAQLKAEVATDKPYGILQAVDGDTSSPVMTQAVNATPAILTQWNTEGLTSGVAVDSSTGLVTVTNTGIYEINMSISFSGTLSKTFVFEIYTNDISASPQPTATGFKMVRKLGTGGDVGSASLSGLVNLTAGDSIMIYVSSSDGGTSVTVHQSQLAVAQV
jgi:hypothetical protein